MTAMAWSQLEYRALVWTHGITDHVDEDGQLTGKTSIDLGQWAPAHLTHPLVRQAEAEGWGGDLRRHVKRHAVRALAGGQRPSLDDMRPDDGWIAAQRARAEKAAIAAEWRKAQPERAPERRADLNWQRALRPGFERMQRESQHRGLHMTLHGLSSTSRRQTGEHKDE